MTQGKCEHWVTWSDIRNLLRLNSNLEVEQNLLYWICCSIDFKSSRSLTVDQMPMKSDWFNEKQIFFLIIDINLDCYSELIQL